MNKLFTRLAHSFNAFSNREPPIPFSQSSGGYGYRPDRTRHSTGVEKSFVYSIYNRIALDVSSFDIKHCKVDDEGRYLEDVKGPLNDILNLEANIDQTGRAFIQDYVLSLFDEGCIAIVPIITEDDPKDGGRLKIYNARIGRITYWYPQHVRVEVFNEYKGTKEEIIVPKKTTCIIENPFYSVMNQRNSTMQRLIRKMNLLDSIDEQSGAGKLDLIIQLPYIIKTEARRQQAETRRKEIEMQLAGSKYGIAYTDGTERVTQLNRPVENNLMKQIEYLTSMLYSQLGFHQTILDGTADEKTMLNYTNRTIEPIASAIVDELKRKFLTKTARTQGQSIEFFRNPFRLVPINNIAEIADKFTRNEILTSNEIRQIIGMKPSNDPKADQLINSNIAQPAVEDPYAEEPYEEEQVDPSVMDEVNEGVNDTPKGVSWDTKVSELT